MRVHTSRGTYYIVFNHAQPPQQVKEVGPIKRLMKDPIKDYGTFCMIKNEEGIVVSQGRSVLHPPDYTSFNKELGRKKALAKALQAMRITKEERKSFWDVYINRPRPVTNKKAEGLPSPPTPF